MLCVFLEEILSLLLPVSTDRRMLTTSVLMEDIGLAESNKIKGVTGHRCHMCITLSPVLNEM